MLSIKFGLNRTIGVIWICAKVGGTMSNINCLTNLYFSGFEQRFYMGGETTVSSTHIYTVMKRNVVKLLCLPQHFTIYNLYIYLQL